MTVYATGDQSTTVDHLTVDDPQAERNAGRTALWIGRAIIFLIYLYVLAIQVVLGMGFVLLLLGANPDTSFTQWVYRSLDRAMEPFRGIFSPIVLGTTGNDVPSVFETSVLFAMLVYAVVAVALHALVSWFTRSIARHDAERQERRLQATYLAAASTLAAAQRAAGTSVAPGAAAPDVPSAFPAPGESSR
jgi:hypothetical protein